MNIVLHRKILNENSTEGNLYVDGKWFCHVIEDRVRAAPGEWKKELKIYGKTAIPYGRYQVLVTWSNKFTRMLTQILNVPDYEGIRIHNGHNELSSAGCPIISYHAPQPGSVANEKEAMNDLCKMVQDAQTKEKIYIDIVNSIEGLELN